MLLLSYPILVKRIRYYIPYRNVSASFANSIKNTDFTSLQKIKTFGRYFTCNFFCQFESFCIKTRTLYFGSIHIRRCASYLLYLRVHFFSNFSCSILAVSKWSVLCQRKKSHKQRKNILAFLVFSSFWCFSDLCQTTLSHYCLICWNSLTISVLWFSCLI